jgi:dATP pyrophosphohydrolase
MITHVPRVPVVKKSNMTKPYKRPESVLVVVYTQDGKVLLLRRKTPADFWQSVTGSLEWNETPEQAARRELFEETGLQDNGRLQDCRVTNEFPILPAWRARYAPDVQSNTEHVFSLQLPCAQEIRLSENEHVEYCWLPAPEAAERAFSWTNRDAINALPIG